MVLLHIGTIKNDQCSGVCVVVPQHIKSQQKFAQVGFVNTNNIKIDDLSCQIFYEGDFDLNKLPQPFCKPDAVIIHEVYYPKYIRIYKNLKKNKVPYIIVPHGCLTETAQRKKWLKKKVGNLLLFKKFIKNAIAVQYLSEKEKNETKINARSFIGTNGVLLPKSKKEAFSRDKLEMVYIGRLDSYHKGIDLLTDAVKINYDFLIKNNCKISMYGPNFKGQHDEVVRQVKEKGISEIVSLNDAVTGAEKENILLNADIFIQTSRSEGMPMGILEALGYGIPCLITKGTNLGENVKEYDAGWVAETNAQAIAVAMVEAVKEKNKWRSKADNAVKLIEENFLWNTIAKQAVKDYENIIKS